MLVGGALSSFIPFILLQIGSAYLASVQLLMQVEKRLKQENVIAVYLKVFEIFLKLVKLVQSILELGRSGLFCIPE